MDAVEKKFTLDELAARTPKTVVPIKIDTGDNIANALTKQEHGIAGSVAQLRLLAAPRAQPLVPTECPPPLAFQSGGRVGQ